MIDVTQPIILHQEPPSHAKAMLRTYGVKLEYRPINSVPRWVLFLPPACTEKEYLRYRGVIQYHIHLPDAFVFTLCTNKDAETGEEYNAVVVPL